MAATATCKVRYGASPGTETTATNWNLMSTDAYDATGTDYQTNRISIPTSGTNYSYERWFAIAFGGTFNLIENIKFYKSAGTLSDAALDLTAGTTDTYATPVNTDSTVATTTLDSWDSLGEAIDITPGSGITSAGNTDFGVVQLEVPDTVTTPGDIGTITITVQYEES